MPATLSIVTHAYESVGNNQSNALIQVRSTNRYAIHSTSFISKLGRKTSQWDRIRCERRLRKRTESSEDARLVRSLGDVFDARADILPLRSAMMRLIMSDNPIKRASEKLEDWATPEDDPSMTIRGRRIKRPPFEQNQIRGGCPHRWQQLPDQRNPYRSPPNRPSSWDWTSKDRCRCSWVDLHDDRRER